ncbi:hypothetical protein ABID42_002392 [Arcicella rosea]
MYRGFNLKLTDALDNGITHKEFLPSISMTKTREIYRNFHIFLFFGRPK